MVIEMLTFEVAPDQQPEWLALEERVWSRFLEQQPGFVQKEIWIEDVRPDLVQVVIWWESMELWKRITPEQVAEVDRGMGDAWRDCTMRVFDVARRC